MEKQEKEKRFGSTGIILIAFLIGIWVVFRMFINPGGGGTGNFNSYAGPVLPMTSLSGAEGVEAARSVDFDFSPYEKETDYSNLGKSGARITDAYDLTNITGEDITVELVYGFQGQFIDHPEEFPVMTVEGETIQPELYPSVDPEGLAWHAYDFDRYSEILKEQDFFDIAWQEPEMPALTLTAYHFTDLSYTGSELAPYPMLTVTFDTDEHTALWTNMVDSIGTEDETGKTRLMFRVDRGEAWLFAVGGTITDMECGGNRDYNINENSSIDVTYKLEVFETDFETVLTKFAEEYDFWEIHPEYPDSGLVTPELLVDGALKRMESMKALGGIRMFSELFYEVVTEHRMMYLVFPVTIPAGQTVTVKAGYIQEPSYDISGPKEYREGFDLATKLGSDLNFTDLTASVSHTDRIELGEQNFGFDLAQGIDFVTLDLTVERYYMEIFLKE